MKSKLKPAVLGFSMVGVLLISGCAPGEAPVRSGPNTLATYRGGQITTEDLDHLILSLPPRARRLPLDEALERDRGLVELLVANRLLLEQAAAEGVRTAPDFLTLHEETRQKLVADDFVRREFSQLEGVTEAEARAYFEAHADEFSQPAKRMTLNIFKRVNDRVGLETATREMQDLRQRILSGESFQVLAREYSDSESAERDGELGWITKANAPPDLAKVVFALEPGVPSEPVVTAEGVHLFMVTEASVARSYTFNEVESRIVSILRNQDRKGFVEKVVADLPKPEPYFVADFEEMDYLIGGGDPEAEVFRIGETSLTVAEFRRLVDRAISATNAPANQDLPGALLAALVNRARIYEHCRSLGRFDESELRVRLEKIADDEIVNYMRERSLRMEVGLDTGVVEAYFDVNRRRFSSPLTLDADVLVVPIPDRGTNTMMDRLSRLDLDPGADRLTLAASELGGEVARVENVPHDQFQRWNRKVARLVSGLEAGRCSQPVRIGDSVVVVEVTRRVEPEPMPFAAVTDEVVRAYLDDHRSEIYENWSRRLLEDADLRIFDDRLETFWRDGGLVDRPAEPSNGPA